MGFGTPRARRNTQKQSYREDAGSDSDGEEMLAGRGRAKGSRDRKRRREVESRAPRRRQTQSFYNDDEEEEENDAARSESEEEPVKRPKRSRPQRLERISVATPPRERDDEERESDDMEDRARRRSARQVKPVARYEDPDILPATAYNTPQRKGAVNTRATSTRGNTELRVRLKRAVDTNDQAVIDKKARAERRAARGRALGHGEGKVEEDVLNDDEETHPTSELAAENDKTNAGAPVGDADNSDPDGVADDDEDDEDEFNPTDQDELEEEALELQDAAEMGSAGDTEEYAPRPKRAASRTKRYTPNVTNFSEFPPRSSHRPRRTGQRKSRPTRSVRPSRSSRATAGGKNAGGGRDALDSFRPLNNSVRPAEFYEANTSSDDSDSSEDNGPFPPGGATAPAPPSGDAVPDYLANPMATADGRAGGQTPRAGRYSRRRNRGGPAMADPYGPGEKARSSRSGARPAGIEPIQVDLNLSWDDIGGLDHHVRALKEMVFLPLMYPEVFEKFKMEPPKGVLFYGPPGTGKTLCARALAASCGGVPVESPASEAVAGPVSAGGRPSAEGPPPTTKSGEHESIREGASATEHISGTNGPEHLGVDGSTRAANVEGVNVANAAGVSAPNAQNGTNDPVPCGAGSVAAKDRGRTGQEVLDAPEVDKADPAFSSIAAAADTTGLVQSPNAKQRPRVAFFMRNGADCLSKWVGEAERQLRMTFEAAKAHQPSIIFFDEIDGLAPVRSARQDQIHSSIVSTLLGLMDGLDARGKIVVIGATNRVDAIDPALRRPGRFDRELIFTLPNVKARRKILGIHTAKWKPSPPSSAILDAVAQRTVGYCGADLRALCSESAIRALRRRYPQIYDSQDKLLINVDEVQVKTRDFLAAMKEIVPASHRSARSHARPIAARLKPVLDDSMSSCISIIRKIFAQGMSPESVAADAAASSAANGTTDGFEDDDDDDDSLAESELGMDGIDVDIASAGKMRAMYGAQKSSVLDRPVLRPRLLLCGSPGLGQSQLGPALLHFLEGCPVHAIDLPSLLSDSGARSPEEALVTAVREACRTVPSILYLPHLHLWWQTANEALKTTLLITLKDIPAELPLFVLAAAEDGIDALPDEVTELFADFVELEPSLASQRANMFAPLVDAAVARPKVTDAIVRQRRKKLRDEILPKAPPPPPKVETPEIAVRKAHEEDRIIRELRMEMRAFVERLLRDRKFKAFWDPVDPKEAPDYYSIIKAPMTISKIAAHVDQGMYPTVLAMVRDFDLMVRNAIQYNPAHTLEGAALLRRAHGLVDIVHSWVDNLNPALVERCNKIVTERVTRARIESEKKKSAEEAVVVEGPSHERPRDADVDTGAAKDYSTAAIEQQVLDSSDRMDMEAATPAMNGTIHAENGLPSSLSSPKRTRFSGGNSASPPTLPTKLKKKRVSENETPPDEQKDDGLSSNPAEEGRGEEAYKPAPRVAISRLQKLIVDVTTGVTVDGLEGLFVKCAAVLHDSRRSGNRAAVVELLTKTVQEARDDPAVVGALVE